MAYRYSREVSTLSSLYGVPSTPLPEEYANVQQLTTGEGIKLSPKRTSEIAMKK